MPNHHDSVSFPTLDGTELRGTLYPANERAPGVILTPGFNCTKEMFLPDVATYFQDAGFTALCYDPRTIGSSGGQPRNDVDPVKQVEDYSDALTFMRDLPSVDPERIFLWGFSFAAVVALCAATMDRRAKAVIAVCPLTKFEYSPDLLHTILQKSIQDRCSQMLGNAPFYLPMITDEGENPAGFGVGIEKENFQMLITARESFAPTFENRTTIQTYAKLYMWQPFHLWRHLSPTPVLFIVPSEDRISPASLQMEQFAALNGPKAMKMQQGKGHMDVLSGEGFGDLMQTQIDFAKKSLS